MTAHAQADDNLAAPLDEGVDEGVDDQSTDQLIGQVVLNYRILRLIDRGGMGAVYEALNETLGQQAAVKVLSPSLSDFQRDAERFLREARACCLTTHEGLVRVYSCGVLPGGRPYILMEYLAGRTLRKLIEALPQQRLSIAEALSIAYQLAAALQAVHARGVVHRDLKPENVMLVRVSEDLPEERTKILDFGIAKILGASGSKLTRTHELLGTPLYMAPECTDLGAVINGQCDVYSLAVLCHPEVQSGSS